MISGHDILCFAPGPWNDIWRNRHQIMSRLARANRVLYVEPWAYFYPTLRCLRNGQMRLTDLRGPRLQQVNQSLYVYQPALWAPRAAEGSLLGIATRAIYMALLRRALRRLAFRTPILWLFLPDMEVFVGRFGEKLVIYHIVDEYAGYSGVSEVWRPVVQRMEQQLAQRADLVFVTSPALLERKRALNERIFLIPNAVDYAAFATVSECSTPPADIANIARPVIGYVGAINDKVDLALLVSVAQQCADWSLLLVGPIAITNEIGQRALTELRALPNVYFVGCKNVQEVPRYVAACDVCLLPYRINEWTRNIDSLKLYEYLACGKPVVATDVPAARQFADVVTIATEQDFALSIDVALHENNPALRSKRRHIAARHTWDERVATLSAAIEGRLRERHEQEGMFSAKRKGIR